MTGRASRQAKSFLIAARAPNGAIGRDGTLPWHAPHDLAHFKAATMGCVMVMGRSTWDSLPRALPGRVSIVVTSRTLDLARVRTAPSLEAAIEIALDAEAPRDAIAFVGGAKIYRQALRLPWLGKALITEVSGEFDGDVFFPELGPEWCLRSSRLCPTGAMPECTFTELVRPTPIQPAGI